MDQAILSAKKELIKKIKQKKELAGLADSFVSSLLESYLQKYKINLAEISDKPRQIIMKDLRAELRLFSGRFQKSPKDKSKLFASDEIEKLLKAHSSTAERLNFYPNLKKIIRTSKAKSILDLGCGLNPFALASNKYVYYASDIREDELDLIKKFFEESKIRGKTFVYDLRQIKDDLPEADICLIFKVLDIIDDKKHRLTEKIIQSVRCKKFLISFSTKKLSGKPMNFPRRFWFEKLLEKRGLNFKTFQSENEIFYLIDSDYSSPANKQSRPARYQE
jgi:2-polyprenyl-3-methyl-5-hydroxy-6-metoxy-1,4-benzoquinol methylase